MTNWTFTREQEVIAMETWTDSDRTAIISCLTVHGTHLQRPGAILLASALTTGLTGPAREFVRTPADLEDCAIALSRISDTNTAAANLAHHLNNEADNWDWELNHTGTTTHIRNTDDHAITNANLRLTDAITGDTTGRWRTLAAAIVRNLPTGSTVVITDQDTGWRRYHPSHTAVNEIAHSKHVAVHHIPRAVSAA